MGLKRAIRPLIPDRVMARYRLVQHSRQVRTNLDLYVESGIRRWLSVTPDTVRVGHLQDVETGMAMAGAVVAGRGDVDPRVWTLLADQVVDAVVVGRVASPALVARRRALPRVAPRQIVAATDVLDEVGGLPRLDGGLEGLYERLAWAGRRMALVAEGRLNGELPARRDPITRPAVVLVSAVPMHDIGGGSRTAQLARTLLTCGFHVTFVSVFGVVEAVDLGLRYIHPYLELRTVDSVDIDALVERVADPVAVIVAIPHPRAMAIADHLAASGFSLAYDLIDDWADPALGAEWFRAGVERDLVTRAAVHIGSAPDLVRRLERTGAAHPILVPNGVNEEIFCRDPGSLPPGWPAGEGPVIGYHGSLYGKWLDWTAVAAVAEADPDRRVILVGNVPPDLPALPGNVYVTGLVAQEELPDYVGRFSVGMIPFVVSDTTHAVSPLKAYEYLAMGVPIAAPPLRSLEGLEGVYAAADLESAVEAALAAERPDRTRALAEHGWSSRARVMLDALGRSPGTGTPPMVVRRPPVRYLRSGRRM